MRVGVFIALYEEASDDCGNDSDSRKGKREYCAFCVISNNAECYG